MPNLHINVHNSTQPFIFCQKPNAYALYMPNLFSTIEFTVVETHGYIQLYIMKKVCTARSLFTNQSMTTGKTCNCCSNNYIEICVFLKVYLLDYGCLCFFKKSGKLKAVKLKHIQFG